MKTYVKIYGPPLLGAIKSLEKISVDMPQVCIYDSVIASSDIKTNEMEGIIRYFASIGSEVPKERCSKIISSSGESLGDYDFYFEWFKKPTMKDINDLIDKVDKTLEPLGVKYTLATK
jgi:hypothetical protein